MGLIMMRQVSTRVCLRTHAVLLAVACGVLASGCNSLLDVKQPDSVLDPNDLNSYQGAIQIYGGAVGQFAQAYMGGKSGVWDGQAGGSGKISDELMEGGQTIVTPDRRLLAEGPLNVGNLDPLYADLQNGRIRVEQGIGALRKYAPSAPQAFTGRLYGLGGYIEVMLAENFCSGVPLSSAPFQGDVVYGGALTTAQIFEQALANFDSALIYAADSTRILNMVRVGKGRALLALGRYAEAAAAVAEVPTTYAYPVGFQSSDGNQTNNWFNFNGPFGRYTVSDREGGTGLDFASANDPRAVVENRGTTFSGLPFFYPLKYPDGTSPVVLADGVEARLIEAEAALQAGDIAGWLVKLNDLRATAISPAMAPLVDPGTLDAQIDLLFRERAFWLFLTGHRLGDLRRLVRQYGRAQDTVFPSGPYLNPQFPNALYGSDVNAPVPEAERLSNPNFRGCLNRGA